MQSTIAAMRPRMRTGVFFTPAPEGDGVLLTKGSDIVTFQGASTYAWLEKLSPHLDGRHSVGDLTASMRPATRQMVERLVGALHEAGLVRDVGDDEEHALSEGELEAYAAEIAFVEAFRSSPALRFQRYRRTRLLVLGSGSVLAAAVEGALLTGVARVSARLTGSEPQVRARLDELAAEARQRDVEQSLDAGSLDAAELQRAVEAADLVLYAADRVDPSLLSAVDLACVRLGRTLIPVTLLGEEAWIGPVCAADRPAVRWGSLWRRLGSPAADARSDFLTGPVPGIVANHLVFRAFESVTGVAEEDASSAGVVRVDLETLQTSVHRLPAAPVASDEGELAERVSALTDERLGVLGPPTEAHYEQFPLRVVRVAVADPGRPGESFPVWGAGADFAQAQDAVLRHGLAAHAVRPGALPADGSVTGFALADGTARDVPADEVFGQLPAGTGAGTTRADAVERALLDHLRRGPFLSAEAQGTALDGLRLTAAAARFRDLLLTTGEELSAYTLRAPAGVTAYLFRLGDEATGPSERGVGFTPAEAAESGLGRLLLAHQAHTHEQNEYAPAPGVSLWAPGEAADGQRHRALVEALRTDGLEPVAVPLDQDPAVHAVLPHLVRVVLLDA
ncbi:hypothetical protein BN159_2351 [Streptomyces davaonensis JCM 4913]|uniref:Thiazole-containing bacteriocin maturation protein n=1 Tax=Streptomyces davaonensis (strain DSM 101723 / JCM 4913 / KCC S-0913 / 768) TaxID=1214101 RepID=K4R0U6_STRDJ|nr:hypothetical protein [Streptomyces davaonensis]CCK26730.1 hypothetical protein BN159_2351 [Streptomyces davaonensis JCM 4913]